jgi:hypothetical protein
MAKLCLPGSSVRRVERDVLRDLPLPAVAVREQPFLVVVEFLACLGRELEVRSQGQLRPSEVPTPLGRSRSVSHLIYARDICARS